MEHGTSQRTGEAPRTTPIGAEEKARLVARNQELLEQDLWRGRLEYRSRPRVVDVQFSNVCNMSCTMCYDGVNPPAVKLPEDLAERLAAEVFPGASVLVPFAGSEPLIVTWDLTRRLAELYALELDVITNVQFLDEAMFAQLEPHVSTLTFSIDSHLRDVFERIRLRSKPDQVFANLPVAARLCREHGIEPQANIVFMVENAPYLDETVAYLADIGCATVRILEYVRLPHVSPEREFSNASLHMSPSWTAWMKERVRKVAETKKIRVILDLHEKQVFDHLPEGTSFRRDNKGSPYFDRLRLYYPGYCWQSVDRVKVLARGDVYPCCIGDSGALQIGDLTRQGFEEVWNGPESRDLRRGMMTWDVPTLCKHCSFHNSWFLEELERLPLLDWYHQEHSLDVPPVDEERRTLEVSEPAHMHRFPHAPTFRWRAPATRVDRFDLVLALGGEYHQENRVLSAPGHATELTIPDDQWAELRSNMGWWWCLYGVDEENPSRSLRTPLLRCFIRHEDLPRVPGSTLAYDGPAAPLGAPRPPPRS